MTTLKSFFAVIVSTVFFLTSCQKDDMHNDLDQQYTMSQSTDDAISAFGSRASKETYIVNQFAQTFDLKGAAFKNENARSSNHLCKISCSTGVIFDSNKNATNSIDKRNMNCAQDNGDPFTGRDKFYYFRAESSADVEGKRRYTITLSDLQDDLDLFVYTLDSRGRVRECKGVSITIGTTDAEVIELDGLSEGYYLVVVDGWDKHVVSSYALELICEIINEATPCWDLNGNGQKDLEEDRNIDHIVNEDDCLAKSLKAVNYQDNGQLPGELTGTFAQEGISQVWTELVYIKGENTPYTYTYDEIGRDQSSVYLRDGSRNIDIRIDLHLNQIVAKQNGNGFASYEVIQKFFHAGGVQITAEVLTKVSISFAPTGTPIGSFEKVGGTDLWREYDADYKLLAEYREVTIVEGAVYIKDIRGNVNLQLHVNDSMVRELKFSWEDKFHIVAMD